MRRSIFALLFCLLWGTVLKAELRHWTAAHGLPTGEVRQMVKLPNGQILVNCEGVFCISDGAGFQIVPCERACTYLLPHYVSCYGQRWEGDSLLWLHDFYRVYLFDAGSRSFRKDILSVRTAQHLQQFANSCHDPLPLNSGQQHVIDSLGLQQRYRCVITDHQGGLWIGTLTDDIFYLPPQIPKARLLYEDDGRIGIARSYVDGQGQIWQCKPDGVLGGNVLYHINNVRDLPYNRTTFILQLSKNRYLLCDSLSTLGYLVFPASADSLSRKMPTFQSLNSKIPALNKYRHFVGACPIDEQWTVVYAQNGCFLLNTKTDTLADFPAAVGIEHDATKYNCMVKDKKGVLWIGTQNGLFYVDSSLILTSMSVKRVEGLSNNCIRSLVVDDKGRLWAGTSSGISRITPAVVNLGDENGIPAAAMMERAAYQTPEGDLLFACGASKAVLFNPDSLIRDSPSQPVVITACRVNGHDTTLHAGELQLAYYQNYLQFQFSTLDYATPSYSRYRYRLMPMEREWSLVSNDNGRGVASYTALPPGDYQLQVQSSSSSGQWDSLTVVNMNIAPPLWLTWWAKSLYVLLAVMLLLSALAYYLKKKRQKMERENDERVNRLFELRDEARHQFAQSVNISPEKISVNAEEETFVGKLLKSIDENMDNLDFTVEQLASDVAMSRASLYKKMQTMLGITPNEFLRSVRMKHAARLLAETQHSVNQISLMVGFQTPRYFSQCFKQIYGMTPSEYRERIERTHSD